MTISGITSPSPMTGARKSFTSTVKLTSIRIQRGPSVLQGFDVHLGGTPTERIALGLMDEIGIFNVSLEQADIQNIMNDGLGSVLGLTPVTPQDRLTTTWANIKSR